MVDRSSSVALVGCGGIARQNYAPALRELEKAGLVRVAALVDPNPARVAEIGSFFPAATALSDLAELDESRIGSAIVASPNRYHAEQSIALLSRGISVLCEKPMAATVREAESMVAAAEAAGSLLAVGLFRRHFPGMQAVRAILSQGLLGPVKSFHLSEGGAFNWPAQSAAYFQKSASFGGVLIDMGVHLIDLMVWWFGQPSAVRYEDDAMGGVEANCHLKLEYAEGFSGELRFSREAGLYGNRCVITCSDGWIGWNVWDKLAPDKIEIGLERSGIAMDAALFEATQRGGLPALGTKRANFHESFVEQIRNLVAAVQGREPLAVDGREGLHSLRLIESCYRHKHLMPMPWLGERELASAERLSALPG